MTIYDVAHEAGVSVATVSRVLNNTAPVSPKTKQKIMTVIEKYQFQRNALARSLKKKETRTLGIILPDITNPFFPEVFSGIELEARENDYTLFLCDTMGEYERETQYLYMLRERQVDGIVFLGGRINLSKVEQNLAEELQTFAQRVPTVLVNGSIPGNPIHRVCVDEGAGTEQAVRHLLALGHTDIAFIGGLEYMTTTMQKIRAFKKVFREHGLTVRKEWILYDDFSLNAGKRQMKKLLHMSHKPTAVLCVNDYTAVGAIQEAGRRGYSIPNDISIIGFDDVPLATAILPEVTTVSQKTELLGRTAISILHKLIQKEKVKKLTVIEPELIIRESTAQL
ncbi:LacI family DNA-binding transcriptional regulator [Paenibacillus yanchengensis]|uniref:LacI family DNA-binding transcriptional regulator n=1 Tax=Paenibacillus yanchengensis TaxID=2035833 RepID=A0ABW4YGJ5_9BACL